MKKLVLKMSMSVDGFASGPHGEIDWLFATGSHDSAAWTMATLWNASHHLMGSRTYHDMAAYWPTSPDPYAAPMNEIPKVVFTNRGLERPDESQATNALKDARAANPGQSSSPAPAAVAESWRNPLVARGDLAEEISRLKQPDGKPLLAHGGAGFARSLIRTGLVDEYRLLVHPVALGRGQPIFSELPRSLFLTLAESVRFSSGAVAQVYRPKI